VDREPSISEILAPFREQVATSGLGDEELGRLFSQAREEAYRERSEPRATKNKPQMNAD
jgi:hypothetical protein